jgi:hypothetical protein
MGFLDNYEASRERLERWLKTYPTGRIETRIVEFSADKGYVLVEAKAFRNQEEIQPAGIDYAYGYQAAYQPNMRRWFVEDSVTSAIMRVQQLVMGGAERSTKEVMEQVERTPAASAAPVAPVESAPDYWSTKFEAPEQSISTTFGSALGEIAKQLGGELVEEAPQCVHGHRIWATGKKKNGEDWGAYRCVEKNRANQCDPVWYVFGSNGKWRAQ